MDHEEADESAQESSRKRLSGHWGGNTAIENLYGKTSEQRKDNILDYIFQGYEPNSKKSFYERNEQTDLVLTDKSDSSIARIEEEFFYRRPDMLSGSPEAYTRLSRSKSKSLVTFSEITITYENQGVGVNVFHFLKRRNLFIPIKDLKKETLRIVVFPPFIELYLGKNQVFPFDFSNVLGQKVKRSFEEKSMEVFQRMPKVFVIKADKNTKVLGEVPLVDVSNRTEHIEDFIFRDKYDYLPTGTSKSKTLGKDFSSRKMVFPDSKRTRCLQRNLANFHKPELYVTESQISLEKKKPEKPNVCEKMKTFFKTGSPPVETPKYKFRESSDDDTIIFKPVKKEPEPEKFETEVKFHRRHISDSITLTHDRNAAKRQQILAKERASRGKPRSTMASSSSYPPTIRSKLPSSEAEPKLTKKEVKGIKIKEFEKALLGSDEDIPEEIKEAPILKSSLKKRLSLYAVPSASKAAPENKGILEKIREHTKSIIKTTKYNTPIPKKSEVSLDGDNIERRKSEKKPNKSIQYAQDTYWDNLYDASKNLHDEEENLQKPKRSFFSRSRENLAKKTSSLFDHMKRKSKKGRKSEKKGSKSAKVPQSSEESLAAVETRSPSEEKPTNHVSKKDEDKKVKSTALTEYELTSKVGISDDSSNGHLRNESVSSESVNTFQKVHSVYYSDDDLTNR